MQEISLLQHTGNDRRRGRIDEVGRRFQPIPAKLMSKQSA
jgi:hypothetical protein